MTAKPAVRRKVCIAQPVMKAYRVPFFTQLATSLAASGIELVVTYGKPWAQEALRGDNVELAPPLGIETPNWIIGGALFIQPILRPWLTADLVIVEHANKHALNFLLTLLRSLGLKRMAYWGHGLDRQSPDPNSRSARLKRWTLRHADWWFAYTQGAARYVAEQGFPASRITAVENAIDTRGLRDAIRSVTPEEQSAARKSLGWDQQCTVLVCCGSLHAHKHVVELIEASDALARADSRIRLLIVGGGPLLERARAAAAARPWVACVGPSFGRDKAVWLSLSTLWLNPGLIGLGVLDAFCAALPVITRDIPIHSPEIEYVQDGINGLIFGPDMGEYLHGVLALLGDEPRLQILKQGAADSAERYSIETMVRNFEQGVQSCLQSRS